MIAFACWSGLEAGIDILETCPPPVNAYLHVTNIPISGAAAWHAESRRGAAAIILRAAYTASLDTGLPKD
jgi:hypothetical protein